MQNKIQMMSSDSFDIPGMLLAMLLSGIIKIIIRKINVLSSLILNTTIVSCTSGKEHIMCYLLVL